MTTITLDDPVATESDPRPGVWVGHAGPVVVGELDRAIEFYAALGLHLIHRRSDLAAMQLRGGTHLVLAVGPGAGGSVDFDLMVNDVDGYRSGLEAVGVHVTEIERSGAHRRFVVVDPDGNEVRVHDSHVVGPA